MELKELLGNDYKDGMTLEEVSAALANKSFVSKTVFDQTAHDLAQYKRDNKGLQDANKTAEEKLNDALKRADQQAKEYAVKSNTLDVERIFTEAGLKKDDYNDFLGDIVTDDNTKSCDTASKIVKMLASQKAKQETEIRGQLLDSSPKPTANTANPASVNYIEQVKLDEAISSGNSALAAAMIRQQYENTAKN